MTVTEVHNPKALTAEPLLKLLRKAFPEGGIVAPDGFDSCVEEFAQMIVNDNFHVLVGVEQGAFKACSILMMPTDKFTPYPQVLNFYNKGSAKLRDALWGEILDVLTSEGYTNFWALNGSGKSDEAWARMFKKTTEMKTLGSVISFEVK